MGGRPTAQPQGRDGSVAEFLPALSGMGGCARRGVDSAMRWPGRREPGRVDGARPGGPSGSTRPRLDRHDRGRSARDRRLDRRLFVLDAVGLADAPARAQAQPLDNTLDVACRLFSARSPCWCSRFCRPFPKSRRRLGAFECLSAFKYAQSPIAQPGTISDQRSAIGRSPADRRRTCSRRMCPAGSRTRSGTRRRRPRGRRRSISTRPTCCGHASASPRWRG
jgi:hypothetical protein